MSKVGIDYELFKRKTLEASAVIAKAQGMNAVTEDFRSGFEKAMWEAREIFMRLEQEAEHKTATEEVSND